MSSGGNDLLDRLVAVRAALADVADPDRAAAMRAYMRDQFAFLGVDAPTRRRCSRPVIASVRTATADELVALADRCWTDPCRELQYVAVDALRAGVSALRPTDLDAVQRYITTKSWWDTVDALASHVVGDLVGRQGAALTARMDEWIDSDDVWLARAAILHQLGYGARTDADRLFEYCDRRADDRDFFIRKAIGWALRQYSRADPAAVRAYVERRGDRLSPLSRREALAHL